MQGPLQSPSRMVSAGILHAAAAAGAPDRIASALALGVAVEHRDRDGSTPLHYAVSTDKLAACKYLVHAGANPLAKDHAGRTPVRVACELGREAICLFLLSQCSHHSIEQWADQDQAGSLVSACRNRSPAVVEALLAKGVPADLRRVEDSDGTPLAITVAQGGPGSIIRALVRHGADPTDSARVGRSSPMQIATMLNDAPLFQTLVEASKDSPHWGALQEQVKTDGPHSLVGLATTCRFGKIVQCIEELRKSWEAPPPTKKKMPSLSVVVERLRSPPSTPDSPSSPSRRLLDKVARRMSMSLSASKQRDSSPTTAESSPASVLSRPRTPSRVRFADQATPTTADGSVQRSPSPTKMSTSLFKALSVMQSSAKRARDSVKMKKGLIRRASFRSDSSTPSPAGSVSGDPGAIPPAVVKQVEDLVARVKSAEDRAKFETSLRESLEQQLDRVHADMSSSVAKHQRHMQLERLSRELEQQVSAADERTQVALRSVSEMEQQVVTARAAADEAHQGRVVAEASERAFKTSVVSKLQRWAGSRIARKVSQWCLRLYWARWLHAQSLDAARLAKGVKCLERARLAWAGRAVSKAWRRWYTASWLDAIGEAQLSCQAAVQQLRGVSLGLQANVLARAWHRWSKSRERKAWKQWVSYQRKHRTLERGIDALTAWHCQRHRAVAFRVWALSTSLRRRRDERARAALRAWAQASSRARFEKNRTVACVRLVDRHRRTRSKIQVVYSLRATTLAHRVQDLRQTNSALAISLATLRTKLEGAPALPRDPVDLACVVPLAIAD
jgi:hypothetical protein